MIFCSSEEVRDKMFLSIVKFIFQFFFSYLFFQLDVSGMRKALLVIHGVKPTFSNQSAKVEIHSVSPLQDKYYNQIQPEWEEI